MKDRYYDYNKWRQTYKQKNIFGKWHIDIEYSFGDYYEVHEDSPLFPFICALCNLSLEQEEEEREKVLWKSTR